MPQVRSLLDPPKTRKTDRDIAREFVEEHGRSHARRIATLILKTKTQKTVEPGGR